MCSLQRVLSIKCNIFIPAERGKSLANQFGEHLRRTQEMRFRRYLELKVKCGNNLGIKRS